MRCPVFPCFHSVGRVPEDVLSQAAPTGISLQEGMGTDLKISISEAGEKEMRSLPVDARPLGPSVSGP